MAQYHYATDMEGSRAVARDIPISPKHSREICSFIRGKRLDAAKKILEKVVLKLQAVPYTRHNFDLGHKPGMAAGRYPVKASQWILKLLNDVEANAQYKGMNTSQLHISHIVTHVASRPWHAGRHRGRKMKRAHVEVVVQEIKQEAQKKRRVKQSGGAK